MGNFRLYMIAFFIVVIFPGCTESAASRSEFALGTVCTITLYDRGKPAVYDEIFKRIWEIDNRMSVHIDGSDIFMINNFAGINAVKVHDDVFMIIERALYYAEMSDGAFNPAVGPLVTLWDIGGEFPRIPSKDEIENILPVLDWRDIEINRDEKTVFLKKPGMALDLGAIAKGYAADEAAEIIRRARIPRAIVDLGGNIITVGEKKDRSLWKIGIQHPYDNRGAYIGIVQVREQTVVTSGVYERYFESEGIRYHHIFSPDGYPSAKDLLSVTIIANKSIEADALSTAAFVLGYEKGFALIESIDDCEVIFVFEDLRVRTSGGVDFILTDDEFWIEKSIVK